MKNLKCNIASGPDGMPTLFIQTYWKIMGTNITKTLLNIINNEESPKRFNNTFIILIPKVENLPSLLNKDLLNYVMSL